MTIPEEISKEEIQRVWGDLGIRDWTELTEASISLEQARIIQGAIGNEAEYPSQAAKAI